jgi:hypothetical protein
MPRVVEGLDHGLGSRPMVCLVAKTNTSKIIKIQSPQKNIAMRKTLIGINLPTLLQLGLHG